MIIKNDHLYLNELDVAYQAVPS